jgi:hypothetical protein
MHVYKIKSLHGEAMRREENLNLTLNFTVLKYLQKTILLRYNQGTDIFNMPGK